LRAAEQIAVLLAANEGLLDDVPIDNIAEAEQRVREHVLAAHPELCERIDTGRSLDDDAWEALKETAADAVADLRRGD
jgi:F-type H+-transporting ATPase subunit alpha